MAKNICGAKAKSTGQPCQKPAGWGTSHKGEGRCRIHGGATPVKHGLYSKYTRHKLSEMIDRMAEDEELLNLRQNAAFLQSLIIDILNRLEDGSLTYDPKLAETLSNISDKLTRCIEKYFKVAEGEKFVLEITQVQQIIEQITIVIREEVKDPATVGRIASRLQEVSW